MEPVDLSFNLCEVNKVLCLLPQYNFTGASTVPIPAIQEKIPEIAYFMPDSEAAATLQLVQIETNKIVACVQITLSNGWSTRQRPVGWLVGGLFIFAFAISAIFTFTDVSFRSPLPNTPYPLISSSLATFAPHPRTFISTTPLLYRFLTLWFFLQHIVLTSILDLNYPLLYRSFALDFSWSFGLFPSLPHLSLLAIVLPSRVPLDSPFQFRSVAGDATTLIVYTTVPRDLEPMRSWPARRIQPDTQAIQSLGDLVMMGVL